MVNTRGKTEDKNLATVSQFVLKQLLIERRMVYHMRSDRQTGKPQCCRTGNVNVENCNPNRINALFCDYKQGFIFT